MRGLLCGDCNSGLTDVELARWRHKHTEEWWTTAVAYLVATGCDPDDPERLSTMGRYHRERRKGRTDFPCGCQHCMNDGSLIVD